MKDNETNTSDKNEKESRENLTNLQVVSNEKNLSDKQTI